MPYVVQEMKTQNVCPLDKICIRFGQWPNVAMVVEGQDPGREPENQPLSVIILDPDLEEIEGRILFSAEQVGDGLWLKKGELVVSHLDWPSELFGE
jgi:hypothetical protein